jgi:Tol biopolymer transport system component
MALASGTRLGAYEVLSLLGSGGMGEVYRAKDTKLGRYVALKILPNTVTHDPERLARFRREAQVLAALNHPHIGAIYGLEDANGTPFLVLELVDGESLDRRIARGPIPVDDALAIAKQIAGALDVAHEKGIIHRDLKPANIALTADGHVKVLDFGLAKALEPTSATSFDLAHSPTITSPAMMTGVGMILGTAAYMSPEQAKGRPADKRSDIWAFGCVLYEMLTGARAFQGSDAMETIVSVVRAEPDWTTLPSGTSAPIRRLLRRALVKRHAERLADMGDARLEIDEALKGAPLEDVSSVHGRESGRRTGVWLFSAATFAAGVLLTMGTMRFMSPSAAPLSVSAPPFRATIELPPDAPLALGTDIPTIGYNGPVIALSRDGAWLAYVARAASERMLYLRDMSSGDVRPLKGTEGATHPFFSPDSRWIGFLTDDHVKKIPREGGTAISLCEASSPVLAWWIDPRAIYFSEVETYGISRVSADGGKSQRVLSAPDAKVYRFDDVLPGAQTALAETASSIGADYGDVVRVDLRTRQTKVIVRSGYAARYVPPGYVLFARAGNLMAVRFDAEAGETAGEPVVLAAGVAMESLFGMLHAAASSDGLAAFVPGADLSVGKLAWVDHRQHAEYLDVPERVYGMVDLAPDGNRVAIHVADIKDYIWIFDIARGEGRRVVGETTEGFPVWSADGRRLAGGVLEGDGSGGTGRVTLHDIAASGAVGEGRILHQRGSTSWSPDGGVLAVSIFPAFRIEFVALEKGPAAVGFEGQFPTFAPDGRWIAYDSFQTGADEVFIRSYPDGKIIGQVSTGSGTESRWKASGDLFYRAGRRWFSTHITTEPAARWDPPRLVFDTDFIDTPGMSYDISADRQRLLVVKRARPVVDSRIEILGNWSSIVERRR